MEGDEGEDVSVRAVVTHYACTVMYAALFCCQRQACSPLPDTRGVGCERVLFPVEDAAHLIEVRNDTPFLQVDELLCEPP